VDDGPVVGFDDVVIGEVEACRGAGLVQGEQDCHNGLSELVFHDESPVGDASGAIMDNNSFSFKAFRMLMQKAG
jgi:hypothetical protein